MDERTLPRFAGPEAAARLFVQMAGEGGASDVAVVRNPSYVSQPFDLYCLAPRLTHVDEVDAVVCDMDGTLTTTEALCLHSLEYMVRRITGRPDPAVWPGLDRERDYPHIIGNSTTRHVEYLVETYREAIQPDAFEEAFRSAVEWTLREGRDALRRTEVAANARALDDGARLRDADPADLVRAAVDVYYARYHQILGGIADGAGARLAADLLGGEARLIEPMPGVGPFVAVVKGWLGTEAGRLAGSVIGAAADGETLAELGARFADRPARLAVVTSSIRYEAEIVLGEVLRVLREEVAAWPVSEACRSAMLDHLADLDGVFDAFISASDSSEIRLKPHRDLYSLALHRLGVPKDRYGCVVGFEDSESGTIAIRAAGVGCCCALPFADTAGHDLSAAAYVARGGLPEVILGKRCFLR